MRQQAYPAEILGIPIRVTTECPPGEMYFLPPDVIQAMDLVEAVATIARHGIIPPELVAMVVRDIAIPTIKKAGAEKRIGCITNLAIP